MHQPEKRTTSTLIIVGGELQLHLAIIFVKSKGGGRFGKNSEGLGGREILCRGFFRFEKYKEQKRNEGGVRDLEVFFVEKIIHQPIKSLKQKVM